MLFAKESGPTSFSSLGVIKKALGTRRVGHTGTLDSFAEGLLVVLVGSERVIEEMVGNNYITVRYTALCQRILEQSEAPAASVFPETFGEPFGEDS